MFQEDDIENTPPLLMMGDLIRYFESQSRLLDKQDHMMTRADEDFTSHIRFNGIPILPPVMTTKRRDEMMTYKRQAQFCEKRMKSRQRSRLMARAQNIMEETQRTDMSGLDTLSSNYSTTSSTLTVEPHQNIQHGETSQTPGQTLTNTALTFATMEQEQGLGETGLQTLDSLSSDLASMEDISLPTDFSGMPLTSVKQQQISQTLARLSKVLNMKESLNSTGSSTVSETAAVALKLSLGSPQQTAARFYNPNNYSQTHSESSSVFHDSQDTIVEVSHELTANSTSGFVSNATSDLHMDASGHSANDSASIANTSHSSANVSSSTVDSQKSNKSSPKSLKNTVHFADYVTEITRQSVEDNITQRKLEDTPINSPKPDKISKGAAVNSKLNEKSIGSPESTQTMSMLNRVEFSPDGDSTPSPIDPSVSIPFQGYSNDCEVSTSDKENELRPVSSSSRTPTGSTSEPTRTSSESTTDTSRQNGSVSVTESSTSVQSFQSSDRMVPSHSTSQSIMSESSHTDVDSSVATRSVSDSQTSVKSFHTSVSDSQSSTLRTEQGLFTKGSSSFNVPTGASTSSTDIQQFIMNIIGNPVTQSPSSGKVSEQSTQSSETDLKKPFRRGHARKGSYTLSEPSPVLLRSHGLTAGERPAAKDQIPYEPPNKKSPDNNSIAVPKKLDYEEMEDNIKPLNIPLPSGPESDAKVDHINRYLSQVQQQKLSEGLPVQSASEAPGDANLSARHSEVVDSISIVQSLIESIESLPDSDPESVLKVHANKIEFLRQQMIAQQRQELEELFVQQRREQFLLQQEVEEHQKRLKEQQDFLASNAPENLKKGKNLSLSMGDLDQAEVKVVNVPSNHLSVSHLEEHNNSQQTTPKQSVFSKVSSQGPKVHRPVVRSPMKIPPMYRRSGPVIVPDEAYHPAIRAKFDRISAVAKGFLTRRLLQSEKVQELLLTIKDTRDFALSFSSETPIKRGNFSHQDRDLLERIIAQLQAALLDIHEIFFDIPVEERMSLIAHTRQLREEKRIKSSGGSLRKSQPKMSAATLKALERKRMAQQAEAAVFGGAVSARPRTAPPTTSSPRATDHRALRPLQGHVSPIRADSNSPRNEKERPRTAPEKSDNHKLRRQSAPVRPASSLSHTAKPAKPQSAKVHNTSKVSAKKPDKKTEKAWR